MSSRQRKRPGGAVDSRPARKRSRLLPSSAGGTSQTEPTDLEESGTPAFEPDVIDLTGEDENAINVAGEEVIQLTYEDAIDVAREEVIQLTYEDAIDVDGEEVIQLRYEGVIHLPGESSEPEVITISDDESSMDREQSQQQLNLSRTSDEPLAREDEEEPRDIDDDSALSRDWLPFDFDPPYWSDEDSEDREQNQQYPHVSSAAGNSADVLASNDEEEPRDVEGSALSRDWLPFDFDLPYWSDEDSESREQNQQDSHLSRPAEISAGPLTTHDEEEPGGSGAWPAGPAGPPMREGDNSQVQDKEQSQQHPPGSSNTENSAELWASNHEEEPRDNDDSLNSDEWPDRFESPPTWRDDITDDWEESQPIYSWSEENLFEILSSNLQQEPRDIEFEPPSGITSPPNRENDNAELLEVHGQERRNVTSNSQEQVDGSGNGTGANDAPVADSAPEEQGAEEEDTQNPDSLSSSAQQGVVIRCPICMESYSEFIQRGRQLVATLCGHVFCSRCLPIALEASYMCPNCRMALTPELYHTIYL
nr:uncharacterized protein LOC115495026 isoform X2 [Taeniopygia guttata]